MQIVPRIFRALITGASVTLLAGACAVPAPAPGTDAREAVRTVEARERAFAQTMAQRDFGAFTSFLSEEAIFMSGDRALRGKDEVARAWQRFFDPPAAPFAWQPDQVEVLPSGTLAWSTGPVRDSSGKTVARFQSVWRLEPPGVWRIVFDKGSDVCPCTGAASAP